MKVLLDAHSLQGPSRNRGIGRYSKNLMSSLIQYSNHEWHILISDYGEVEEFLALLSELNKLFRRENIHILPQLPPDLPSRDIKRLREFFIDALGMDALIIFDLFESGRNFQMSINQYTFIPSFVILYDLIPLQEPETHFLYPGSRESYDEALANLSRCQGILSISKYTADSLVSFFPNLQNNSFVIGGGPALQVIGSHKIEQRNVLFIGGDHPRKNTAKLIEAWQSLPKALIGSNELIIVGDYSLASKRALLSGTKEFNESGSNIRFTGRVDDESLSALISSSIGLIHPAHSEGLGLPILEAIHHGIPAICSNSTGMTEIGGIGAVIDPSSVQSICTALQRFFSDKDFLKQLLESQRGIGTEYSWSAAAENLVNVLERYSSGKADESGPEKADKLSLAVVGPGPNQLTGISRYAEQTTLSLSQFYKTTYIPTEELEFIDRPLELLKQFDRVLVHLGNSPHHAFAYGLVLSMPSVVFLHEIEFAGTIELIRSEILEMAGPDLFRDGETLKSDYCKLFLGLANGVLIHSRRAKKSLISSGLSSVPIMNVPHPFLGTRVKRRVASKNESQYLLVSCGFLNPNKRPELIIQALGLVNSDLRDRICLEFIGECDINYRHALEFMAKENGVKFSISGFVELDDLHSRLVEADLAIQLRLLDSGEASGTLADLLSFGVPTIVNSLGPFIDLPDDICIKLSPHPTAQEIASTLERLLGSDDLNPISARAISYTNKTLQISQWGESVQEFIESSYKSSVLSKAVNSGFGEEAISGDTAAYILGLKRLVHRYLNNTFASDTTNYTKTTFLTGIQRATIEIHKNLIRVLDEKDSSLVSFNLGLVDSVGLVHPEILNDPVVQAPYTEHPYVNVLLLLDLDFELANSNALSQISRQNGFIVTLIYDSLPLTNPAWFPQGASQNIYLPWLRKISKYSNLIVVNSEFVKSKLLTIPEFSQYKGEIEVIRLGSFLEKPAVTLLRNPLEALVVATLEPRKGHDELLDAFDELLADDLEPVLHLVGRQGWMTEELVARIIGHNEFGNKLKWHSGLEDSDLKHLYSTVGVTIVPSRGEGYGLPILEALSQNCPVISRDIPVFREFESFGVEYFDSEHVSLSGKWREVLLGRVNSNYQTPNYDYLPTFKDFSTKLVYLISKTLGKE